MKKKSIIAAADRAQRALLVAQEVKALFPDARIELNFTNSWELLVAVVLSAQCTDKKVNEVTAQLFLKYPRLEDYLAADPNAFEDDIRPTGFFRNKARNILSAARIVRNQFGGKVPEQMEALLSLPGVGRKTANIIQGNAYGIVEGIAVDTHVRRLCIKLELTDQKDPDKIEQELMRLLPPEEWFPFSYRMITYGRRVCPARRHPCRDHPLTRLYPAAADRWP